MLLLLNKPTGCTSYDLIRKLKKIYPGEKIGHAGTLDPLATGLMIVAIGKDTKRLTGLVGLDKVYHASIDFSKLSDTWDIDYWEFYQELQIKDHQIQQADGTQISFPTTDQITHHLDSIVGTHPLPLTPFSAKKWKGKKLYEYARAGNPVTMHVPMELKSYKIISYQFPILQVQLHVGSGTYIRSIAHRLGSQLGLGGILIGLHRERIGKWQLSA